MTSTSKPIHKNCKFYTWNAGPFWVIVSPFLHLIYEVEVTSNLSLLGRSEKFDSRPYPVTKHLPFVKINPNSFGHPYQRRPTYKWCSSNLALQGRCDLRLVIYSSGRIFTTFTEININKHLFRSACPTKHHLHLEAVARSLYCIKVYPGIHAQQAPLSIQGTSCAVEVLLQPLSVCTGAGGKASLGAIRCIRAVAQGEAEATDRPRQLMKPALGKKNIYNMTVWRYHIIIWYNLRR